MSGADPGALAKPSWARAFPGTPRQVGAARRFVASLLDGSPFCDDAVVVVSELFTNALLHTDSGKPGGLVVVHDHQVRQVSHAVSYLGQARIQAAGDEDARLGDADLQRQGRRGARAARRGAGRRSRSVRVLGL